MLWSSTSRKREFAWVRHVFVTTFTRAMNGRRMKRPSHKIPAECHVGSRTSRLAIIRDGFAGKPYWSPYLPIKGGHVWQGEAGPAVEARLLTGRWAINPAT